MTSEREALAAAIFHREVALEGAAKARETVDRARAFVSELEGALAEFSNLDAEIAASRAEAIKSAIELGTTPILEPRDDLAAAMARKVEAENRLNAARQAVAALDAQLDAANVAAARADLEVEWAAENVVAAEAEELAVNFSDRLAELRRDYYRLLSVVNLPVRIDPAAPRLFGSHGANRRVKCPPSVALAVRENILGDSETRLGFRHRDEMASAVSDYFKRLKSDADASFGVSPA